MFNFLIISYTLTHLFYYSSKSKVKGHLQIYMAYLPSDEEDSQTNSSVESEVSTFVPFFLLVFICHPIGINVWYFWPSSLAGSWLMLSLMVMRSICHNLFKYLTVLALRLYPLDGKKDKMQMVERFTLIISTVGHNGKGPQSMFTIFILNKNVYLYICYYL